MVEIAVVEFPDNNVQNTAMLQIDQDAADQINTWLKIMQSNNDLMVRNILKQTINLIKSESFLIGNFA